MSFEVTDVTLDAARIQVATPARPSGVGVLLYPTIMGNDQPMRGFAADLAARDMTVATWDPYAGAPTSSVVMEMVVRSKAFQDEAVIAELKAITGYMHGELGLKHIGGVGWCFGGRIGLMHAGLDPRISVLCAYNPTILPIAPVNIEGVGVFSKADMPGQTMDEFDLSRRIVGPVQVTRPGHDFTQPAEYDALAKALFERDTPTFYENYPGVGHGFSYTPGEANERAQRYAWMNTVALLSTLKPTA